MAWEDTEGAKSTPGNRITGTMKAFVAVTDRGGFEHLSPAGTLDEVNFWQPSPGSTFQAVRPGEVLLFKLHSPDNFIVGGGVFSHWTRLRASLAWDAFDIKNGAENLPEMRARIERYRRTKPAPQEDYEIGFKPSPSGARWAAKSRSRSAGMVNQSWCCPAWGRDRSRSWSRTPTAGD